MVLCPFQYDSPGWVLCLIHVQHYARNHTLPSPPSAITIGFTSGSYRVDESVGSVNLVVEILSGQFAPHLNHTVLLELQDGSAQGM